MRKELKVQTNASNVSATVRADPSALSQVLDNLLSNAVKFSPPNKEITVNIRCTEASVECTIQDQGPGFTADDKPRMFRRYGRLSARPTGSEPSTPMGLSIVKKVVHEMKGEITCESTPGQGATFIFRLPRLAPSGTNRAPANETNRVSET